MIGLIARHELRRLFVSPLAWLVLAIAQALLAWVLLEVLEQFTGLAPAARAAGLTQMVTLKLVGFAALVVLFAVPLIAMRLISDELRTGSIRLLLAAPVSDAQILLGKYLGLVGFLAIPWASVALMGLSLALGTTLDLGLFAAALLGLALLTLMFAAIGLYLSSLTAQPAAAAFTGYGVLVLLSVVGGNTVAARGGVLPWLSWQTHLLNLQLGWVRLGDLGYFLALTLLFLALTRWRLARLRFSPFHSASNALGDAPAWSAGQREIARQLALLVAVVVLGGALARAPLGWDWTAGGRNSLSEATHGVVARLDAPVGIDAVVPEIDALRREVAALLERYRELSPHIDFRFMTPAELPERARRLGVEADGELVIRYRGREERLRRLSEARLTGALQRLLGEDEKWLAFLLGHGERDLLGHANHDWGSFGLELELRGFRLQPLTLDTAPAIPANARALVVASPQMELLPGEIALLRRHLVAGGNLLLAFDPAAVVPVTPLLAALGIGPLPGRVIDLGARELGIRDPGVALVSGYPDHPATREFALLTLYPGATALEADPAAGWRATPLLATLPRTWNETGQAQGVLTLDPEAGERRGPLVIGYALSRPHPLDAATGEQRVLVVGDGDFLANGYLNNAGNLDLGLNLMSWLAGDERLLDIPALRAPDERFEPPQPAATLLGFGYLIGLPVLYLGLGVAIHRRRRRG